MDDLIAFLNARLDEDQKVAESATTGPWTVGDAMARDGVKAIAVGIGEFEAWVADCSHEHMGPFAVANAQHIARHDPARVLADVESKRLLLDLHKQCNAGCYIARVLAMPYADHPDFQAAWRTT